jgi:hypothetical protein
METIKLKLHEFYTLDSELNGSVNKQTGEKVTNGLLQEKLSLITKYWLSSLSKTVVAEKVVIDELKNELVKKFGKDDGQGNISLPMIIDDVDAEGNPVKEVNAEGTEVFLKRLNPDYQQFETEFSEFLQTEKEIEYKPFQLTDFEKVETTENYSIFFRLITVADGVSDK